MSESSGLLRPSPPPSDVGPEPLAGSLWDEPAFSQVAAAGASLLSSLRAAALLLASAASGAVAACGLALLGYLLVTRALTPPQSLYARALHIDFSAADIVGEAALLPAAQVVGGVIPDLPPSTRALQPGQVADVWVELRVPRALPSGGGMVQLVAELASLDGKLAARASKPLLISSTTPWGLWSLLTAPLRWVGLGGDSRLLVVPLLRGYRERAAPPGVVFRLYIKSRNPTWSPEVLGAEVKLALRLGFLRRVLYILRPHTLLGLLLAGAGLAAAFGGSAAAVLLLGLWLHPGMVGGKGGKEGAPEGGEEGSAASSELPDVSSVSGASDVESDTEGLAESDLESEAGEAPPWRGASDLASVSEISAATSSQLASPRGARQRRGYTAGGVEF